MSRQFTLLGNLIIVTALASVFSLFTLWLLDSWTKYSLFLFEILTIILLYLIINDYEVNVRINLSSNLRLNWGLVIDSLLLSFSSILLILCFTNTDVGVLRAALALLCTSLLPGYALLNISGLRKYFSRIEGLVLSYLLSYIYTGLVVLVLLPVNGGFRATAILISYIGLGMASIMKHINQPTPSTQKSLSRGIDLFALILSMGFYTLSFIFVYPGLALLPGTDISRHYASSVVLWRTPELYWPYGYFLAHLHEAAFVNLSNAPITIVQTALILLNLMMPLAFYAMAKSYLERIDRRLPVISTIFYSTFSGFAWIHLARLKLDGAQGSILSLLRMVNDRAYNGAMYLAQPFMWYVPLSLSFTILIVQLMLLKKLDMKDRHFIATFSLLLIASYMVHVTEAVIFSLFLSFYAFFSKGSELRIDDALKASIISFACLSTIYIVILQYWFALGMWFFLITTLFLPMAILSFTYVFRRLAVRDRLILSLRRLAFEPLVRATLHTITYIYLLGLLVWIVGVPSFRTWMVVDVGSIPWFIYPVFLGIPGLLMLASLYYLTQDSGDRRLLMPFIALIIFSLVCGKALTFININFLDVGYWEKRFTAYFYLASSVIAPIAAVRFFEGIRVHWIGIKKTLVTATIVCLIAIYGLQSMFIVLEYWNTVSAYRPSQEEMDAVHLLAGILHNEGYAYTVTLTGYSYDVLAFSAPPYKLTGMQIVYTAENPEMTLLSLKAHNLSHAYLYMHNRDYEVLKGYSGSWLSRHLTPILPTVYKNSEVTIYNVSSVSFPQFNSTAALVVPLDGSLDPKERWLYSYDVLSLGEYNYTVIYDLDKNAFSYSTLILSFDPPKGNVVRDSFYDDFAQERGWREISGTWQYKGDGLAAGRKGEYQDAIILSPVSGRNFTADICFRLVDGDLKVANYVSIIYDWRDNQNFKYAGLMFDGSGAVYAYFSSYEDGKATVYPSWPGLNTGLRWRFGDSFNLTLSAQSGLLSLYVNGARCLSRVEKTDGGRLGIRMTRFYQVLFSSFKAEASRAVEIRGGDEYLEYVRNGGRLIVLNTNGYGYFADRALDYRDSQIEANMIDGSENIKLPLEISVPNLYPKEGVKVISYYKSQQGSTAYAFREEVGSGEIVYINLHPIIEAIRGSQERPAFYSILGRLLEPAGVQLEGFEYTPPPIKAAFKEVEMSGSVEISTSSLLLPTNLDFKTVEVVDGTGRVSLLDNVSGLRLSNYNNVSLTSSNLKLSEGRGFYSNLKFKDNVTMTFDGGLTSVVLTTKDGETLKLDNVKAITVYSDKISLYAFEPVVTLRGEAYFRELYSSGATLSKTRAYGQDLKVDGAVTLEMYLSDAYSWASFLEISGRFERVPPPLPYDELTSLPQAAFWSIILAPIFTVMLLIMHREKKG
jgi:hypothetical protein